MLLECNVGINFTGCTYINMQPTCCAFPTSVTLLCSCFYIVKDKRSFDQTGITGGLQPATWSRLKRSVDQLTYGGLDLHDSDAASSFDSIRKKAFDYIDHSSSFGKLHKKAFDTISGTSAFGGLQKRAFDFNDQRNLDKRYLDSTGSNNAVEDLNAFGGLTKKSFDSIDHSSAFGGLNKKSFDSIDHSSAFGGLNKKAFDSIDHSSAFGGFKKRQEAW